MYATLDLADLSEANLSVTNLFCATLRGTTLRHADIRSADMSNTRLDGAILIGADLRRTTLSGADLRTTLFEVQDLDNACWDDAKTFPSDMQISKPAFNEKWCGSPSQPIPLDVVRAGTPVVEHACIVHIAPLCSLGCWQR